MASTGRLVTDYSKKLFQNQIVRDENALVFTIDNFLSKQECEDLINLTEKAGYEPALVNTGADTQLYIPEYRKSDRCIIDDSNMAALFLERLKDHIPQEFQGLEVVGINERMRFLRYDKGCYFKPHFDGSYTRPDGSETSLITFFLYLNEGYRGGPTAFLRPDKEIEGKGDRWRVPCPPKTGRLLVFQHHIYHEGALLEKGRKYALRTDIMFRKKQASE